MNPAPNLFFIGPMGAGKTTIGRGVAELVGLPFFDLDHEIEAHCGAAIPLIFDIEGECGFRQRESAALTELTARSNIVLATGGGAVLAEETRALLAQRGWVAYLETSVAQQVERAGRTTHRPLLRGADPRERLEELMRIREPLYRATADFVLSTTRRRVPLVAEKILQAWREQTAVAVAQALPDSPPG